MSQPQNAFTDYQSVWNRVAGLTVEKLKNVLKHHNATYNSPVRLTGLKADLVSRVRTLLSNKRQANMVEEYNTLAYWITNPDSIATYATSSAALSDSPHRAYPLPHTPSSATPRPGASPSAAYSRWSTSAAVNNGNEFPAYASNFNMAASLATPAANPTSTSSLPVSRSIVWRAHPFYSVQKTFGDPVVCPRAHPGDRKSVSLTINLTPEDRDRITAAKASPTNPQYQLRLFCTSETYYNLPQSSYNWPVRSMQPLGAAPVEFPGQSELRINGVLVSANLRGVKKKEGSTMPPDLGKPTIGTHAALNLQPGASNRVELIYVNSTDKRYFMSACLVLYTTVEEHIKRVKAKPLLSKAETVKKLLEQNADPDIVATSSSLGLKCPLTFMRLSVPIRSTQCSHLQCFDAASFFSMMEQTPIFNCPVCNKDVKVDDLAVDEFTRDILQLVSDRYESVVVEVDGTWHTEDGKISSNGRAQPSASEQPARAASLQVANQPSQTPQLATSNVEILDSDDDGSPDPGQWPKMDSAPAASTQSQSAVIDLTLSDDDDGPYTVSSPVRPPQQIDKRPRPSDLDFGDDHLARSRPRYE